MPLLRKLRTGTALRVALLVVTSLALSARAQTGSFELKPGLVSPADAPKLANLVAGVRVRTGGVWLAGKLQATSDAQGAHADPALPRALQNKNSAAIQSFEKLFTTLTAGQNLTLADVT